ncbi:MAG: hypothetical protein LCH51_02105 [Bacteroidetes bacterium]|nr:hypothetical protein [Bacteroidota bacterium]
MQTNNDQWSLAHKMLFRYVMVYFLLMLTSDFGGELLFTLIKWTGKNIFQLPQEITIKPNGSGDTTYNYVQVFLWMVFSLFITVVWTLLDKKRKNEGLLSYCTRILVRYYLAFTLLSYGAAKILQLQFGYPTLSDLLEPLGEMSPMGLAWNFMGYSRGYNLFTGGAEALAGVLLLFRRTSLLGALLSFAVMLNVFAMNMAFDIPVKLFSAHLTFFSAWLAAHDGRRLVNMFILNKPVTAADLHRIRLPKKWMRVSETVVKIVLTLGILIVPFVTTLNYKKQENTAKHALYGIYTVDQFVLNGDTLPPLTTDTVRWKQLVSNWPGYVGIKTMADSSLGLQLNLDTVGKKAELGQYNSDSNYQFIYEKPAADILILRGRRAADSLWISFKRFDENKFLLNSRGFHWINEYPFNR